MCTRVDVCTACLYGSRVPHLVVQLGLFGFLNRPPSTTLYPTVLTTITIFYFFQEPSSRTKFRCYILLTNLNFFLFLTLDCHRQLSLPGRALHQTSGLHFPPHCADAPLVPRRHWWVGRATPVCSNSHLKCGFCRHFRRISDRNCVFCVRMLTSPTDSPSRCHAPARSHQLWPLSIL